MTEKKSQLQQKFEYGSLNLFERILIKFAQKTTECNNLCKECKIWYCERNYGININYNLITN